MTEPRPVITDFLERLSAGDIDGAMGLCSDDCRIWIATQPAVSRPVYEGATLTPAEFSALLRRTAAIAPDGMRFTILRTLAEGPDVLAEVAGAADLADGRRYVNRYAFVFTVAGGHITELREYLDTKLGHDFLLPLLADEKVGA